MRYSGGEFRTAVEKAAKTQQLASTWPVYTDIEVVTEGERVYLHAPLRRPGQQKSGARFGLLDQPDPNLDRRYSPLRDVPDLFLRFARLAPTVPISHEELLEITLEWVKSYGALGSYARTDIRPVDTPQTLDYSTHPGRIQSLLEFHKAGQEALYCLKLYEAANAHRNLYGGADVDRGVLADEDALADVLSKSDRKNKSLKEQRDRALTRAMLIVAGHVQDECYPVLYRHHRQTAMEGYETSGFSQGWGFRSLLGAMYLQMMWLMTSANAAKQCEYEDCFNIITFGSPVEDAATKSSTGGKYRTRKDKRFCSKNCAQKWRYHHVLKPRRQAQG